MVNSNLAQKLHEATDEIDTRGNRDEGSNKQAEFEATAHVVPGYYPDEQHYYIGVDVTDEWIQSASLSVQYILPQYDLLSNSFYTDEFTGYGNDNTHVEHDYIFHVVPLGWLPDREGPQYD